MLILFILITWGISNVITTEYVFKWFRKLIWKLNNKTLYKLTTCQNCLSFWVGFGLSFILPLTPLSILIVSNIFYGILGFASIKLINTFLSDKTFVMEDDYKGQD